ncbi:hypothetical protein [Salinarimonas sp.]|uniref:hypothetical protein n=1 Tax=Salinarimonas sp. TaxID=2766526 RepID=UPI0032D8CD98
MPERASACPLADLCLEAERLALARRAVEGRGLASEDGRVRRAADRAVDEIAVTLGHIAQRASDARPRSRAGALFALACAAGEAEALEVADAPPPGAWRRLRRHLWSLRAFLEEDAAEESAAGESAAEESAGNAGARASLPEAVGEFFMPRHRDPHALVRDAVENAREVA